MEARSLIQRLFSTTFLYGAKNSANTHSADEESDVHQKVGSEDMDNNKDCHNSIEEEEEMSNCYGLEWKYLYPVMDILAKYDLEEHIEEVLYQIYGQPFMEVRKAKGIHHWSIEELVAWIKSLHFLGEDVNKLVKCVYEEYLDGESFTFLLFDTSFVSPEKELALYKLPSYKFFMLRIIFTYWKYGMDYTLPDPLLPSSVIPTPLGVLAGYVNDLRHLSEETTRLLVEINQRCCTTASTTTIDSYPMMSEGTVAGAMDRLGDLPMRGDGCLYGQLVVVGHQEYRSMDVASIHNNNPNNSMGGSNGSIRRWIPFGLPNNKYPLHRRKVANGLMLVPSTSSSSSSASLPMMNHGKRAATAAGRAMTSSSSATVIEEEDEPSNKGPALSANNNNSSKIIFRYMTNALTDRFQLGRAVQSTNDIVLPGPIHPSTNDPPMPTTAAAGSSQGGGGGGSQGQGMMAAGSSVTSSISRWAARIECDRIPPFAVRIYAGGFNEKKELPVKGSKSLQDGFTTFGIYIKHPLPGANGDWMEVSVLGKVYTPRSQQGQGHGQSEFPQRCLAHHSLGNRLVHGTLIDLCGVILMYEDPVHMMYHHHDSKQASSTIAGTGGGGGRGGRAARMVAYMNSLQPQCPVQMQDIFLTYQDGYTRMQQALYRQYLQLAKPADSQAISLGDATAIAQQQQQDQGGQAATGNHGQQQHQQSMLMIHHHPTAGTGGGGGLGGTDEMMSSSIHHPQHLSVYKPLYIPPIDYTIPGHESNSSISLPEHRCYVYPSCGHVYGYHPSLLEARPVSCPLCRRSSPAFVPLIITEEAAFDGPFYDAGGGGDGEEEEDGRGLFHRYSSANSSYDAMTTQRISASLSRSCSLDNGLLDAPYPSAAQTAPPAPLATEVDVPTHVFNPCGHTATAATVHYWCHHNQRIIASGDRYPYTATSSASLAAAGAAMAAAAAAAAGGGGGGDGGGELISICPYCGIELAKDKPYSRLIIQTNHQPVPAPPAPVSVPPAASIAATADTTATRALSRQRTSSIRRSVSWDDSSIATAATTAVPAGSAADNLLPDRSRSSSNSNSNRSSFSQDHRSLIDQRLRSLASIPPVDSLEYQELLVYSQRLYFQQYLAATSTTTNAASQAAAADDTVRRTVSNSSINTSMIDEVKADEEDDDNSNSSNRSGGNELRPSPIGRIASNGGEVEGFSMTDQVRQVARQIAQLKQHQQGSGHHGDRGGKGRHSHGYIYPRSYPVYAPQLAASSPCSHHEEGDVHSENNSDDINLMHY